MLLRKPYAFFIKLFKPIHFALSLLICYSIYLSNKILNFLNVYIYSDSNVVGQNIKDALVNNSLYIIPIVLILFSLLIIAIMFRKNKPFKFYIINIFLFIIVLVINLYASNFLHTMEEVIVSIKSVKLIHDLVLISIIIQGILFIFFVIRGTGVNFKKFDFDSDISKFDISESDKEIVELDINVDLSEKKRNRKRKLRFLKYAYVENKFIVNCISAVVVLVLTLITFLIISNYNKPKQEGIVYSASTFNFGVDKTYIVTTDYRGNKITDDYLIVVNTKLKANFGSDSLYLKDFNLKVGEVIYKPTKKYNSSLIDLGNIYNENVLDNEYTNYIFIYEISEKYINSEMYFSYNDQGNSIDIKLNPKELKKEIINESKKLGEEISFDEVLGEIKFKINSYDISNRFVINYNYCVKENDCLASIEYLKPTLNTNFDKYIMKINVEYSDNSTLNVPTFYKFFSNFISIYYLVDDVWYVQSTNFEEIKSTKVSSGNDVYIGVNSKIANATSLKFVLNIRDSKYEYIIK